MWQMLVMLICAALHNAQMSCSKCNVRDKMGTEFFQKSDFKSIFRHISDLLLFKGADYSAASIGCSRI